MSKNLYIATTEAKSGKSVISLGIMELLQGSLGRVAFFRPIIASSEQDPDIELIMSHCKLQMKREDTFALTFKEARELLNRGAQDELIEIILNRYKRLESEYEFVLIEGTDFASGTSAFEFDINALIAKNLGAPVLAVINGKNKSSQEALDSLALGVESLHEHGCTVVGAIVNRAAPGESEQIRRDAMHRARGRMVYVIPEVETLGRLTMMEIHRELGGEIIAGGEGMHRSAAHHVVAAMHLENFLLHITEGTLVITPGDRADIVLGSLLSAGAKEMPHVMGIILTGGLKPPDVVMKLIRSIPADLPILSVQADTLRTISRINTVDCKILPEDKTKIGTALDSFEANVNVPELREKITIAASYVVTPKMFEYGIMHRARAQKKHIVLPEGQEERILRAAEILLRREIVDITLLGNVEEIQSKIVRLGLNLESARFEDPARSTRLEQYAQTYYEARKHKGITIDNARDVMMDVSYFGTMMVHRGDADGMVSGSVNTTQHTVRPALEFVKTRPGFSLVSSVFFMCLVDRVLVYGDCAVNPNPNAKELAEIAVASARTAMQFGIDPRVAMLSYSTGSSGKGEDVEKVREAARLAQEMAPELKIEGPMQYDAAVDMEVARTKMPNSQVAGQATVFIFPDLNTGNNTYKAVQRSANAVAIGPVLQGLNKPVNDLSRGCTVPDIINTVAITAIQAQGKS